MFLVFSHTLVNHTLICSSLIAAMCTKISSCLGHFREQVATVYSSLPLEEVSALVALECDNAKVGDTQVHLVPFLVLENATYLCVLMLAGHCHCDFHVFSAYLMLLFLLDE